MAGRPKRRARLAAEGTGEHSYDRWEREEGERNPVFAELTAAKDAVLEMDAPVQRLAALLLSMSPEGRKRLIRSIPRKPLGGIGAERWLSATIDLILYVPWIDAIKTEREDLLYGDQE